MEKIFVSEFAIEGVFERKADYLPGCEMDMDMEMEEKEMDMDIKGMRLGSERKGFSAISGTSIYFYCEGGFRRLLLDRVAKVRKDSLRVLL